MTDNNINAYCSVCGNGYHICNSCAEQKSLKPWRSVTDTIEHYKIYLAIHGYTLYKDKESAKKELENCDLSGLENFNPEIRSVIKEIMAEPKKRTVAKKDKSITEVKKEENNIIE